MRHLLFKSISFVSISVVVEIPILVFKSPSFFQSPSRILSESPKEGIPSHETKKGPPLREEGPKSYGIKCDPPRKESCSNPMTSKRQTKKELIIPHLLVPIV